MAEVAINVYSCAQTCTSGTETLLGISVITTSCCQTDNCNTVSFNSPLITSGNVSSCYTGVIAGFTGSAPVIPCISPMNVYCKVCKVIF